jgi:hypothetical protein
MTQKDEVTQEELQALLQEGLDCFSAACNIAGAVEDTDHRVQMIKTIGSAMVALNGQTVFALYKDCDASVTTIGKETRSCITFLKKQYFANKVGRTLQ